WSQTATACRTLSGTTTSAGRSRHSSSARRCSSIISRRQRRRLGMCWRLRGRRMRRRSVRGRQSC
ncbi:hypothetical protein DXG03_008344, partial [Asterophora parasitica]